MHGRVPASTRRRKVHVAGVLVLFLVQTAAQGSSASGLAGSPLPPLQDGPPLVLPYDPPTMDRLLAGALPPGAWPLDLRPDLPPWLAGAPAVLRELPEDWPAVPTPILSGPIEGRHRIDDALRLDGVQMRMAPGSALYVEGDFVATGARFEAVAHAPTMALGAPAIVVGGTARVEGSTFDGVTLAIRDGPGDVSIGDSIFRHGPVGLATERANVHVDRSTFVGLGVGFGAYPPWPPASSSEPAESPAADAPLPGGPVVQNSTFEMNVAGLNIGFGAGHYHHNLARANVLGVSCTSGGVGEWDPLIEWSNVFSNYGEGVHGIRGVSIDNPAPLPDVNIPDSSCDYDHIYLGPEGDAQDTTYLSGQDSFENVEVDAVETSAPPLPLPLTLVTNTQVWTGTRTLSGPVVVNSPGNLTLRDATLEGAYFLGAKKAGQFHFDGGSAPTGTLVVLRNDADKVEGLALGTGLNLLAPPGIVLHRCNCTVDDTTIHASRAIVVQSGAGTDDTVWVPHVRTTTITAMNGIVATGTVKVELDELDMTVTNALSPFLQATLTLSDSDVRATGSGYVPGGIGTGLTSSGNLYQGGNLGARSLLLDTTTFTDDVFVGWQTALEAPALAAATVTRTNFTLNRLGLNAARSTVTVTQSNFVDNVPLAMHGVGTVVQGQEATAITCNACWMPDDEAWLGKGVSVTPALAPNDIGESPFADDIIHAFDGETIDLPNPLRVPAVAKSGGTLRFADGHLLRFGGVPLLVKGGGMEDLPTGRLELDNATIALDDSATTQFAGQWTTIVANSTSSSVTQTRFLGGGIAPVFSAFWNGFGSFECVDARGLGNLVTHVTGPGGSDLDVRRALLGGGGIVTTWGDPRLPNSFGVNLTIRDSALLGSGALVERKNYATVVVEGTNMLGAEPPAGKAIVDGARSDGTDLDPIDVRHAWWGDADGPNQGGRGWSSTATDVGGVAMVPLVEPFASSPNGPEPCVAFDQVTARPVDDDPVTFRDRSFDPSGFAAARTWDFGDGTVVATNATEVVHAFPGWGTYTVTLTLESEVGGVGSTSREVVVLGRPIPSFETPSNVVDAEPVVFTDTSTDPDGEVVAWAWDFGDGATSTARHPSHKYADGGAYAVRLTVTDDDGLAKSTSQAVEVLHAAPRPDFLYDADELMVNFADASTHPNAADAPPSGWSWAWDFGDGATASERNPEHAYAAQDVYGVTLTVTDDDGVSSRVTKSLDLRNKPPTANWTVNPVVPVMGGEASFTDTSSDPDGSIVAWAWDFGDGATSTAQHPTHTYGDGGDFKVSLKVTDNQGATATMTRVVHVCETGLTQGDGGLHLEVCSQVTSDQLIAFVLGAPALLLEGFEGAGAMAFGNATESAAGPGPGRA